MSELDLETATIVFLGDPGVGISYFLSQTGRPVRDLDQPYVFEVSFTKGKYRLEIYDTSSPENYTLLQPDVVVLCYDVSSRASLESLGRRWAKEVHEHYLPDRPTLVLGLKRDLRTEEGCKLGGPQIDPLEGYKTAQGLRCDRYMECSAVTGELLREAWEDISRTAVKSITSEHGGLSQMACTSM